MVETNGAGARVHELGEAITHVRHWLDALVVELDRSRLLTDLNRRLPRDAGSLAVGALVVAALVAAPMVLSRTRAKRQGALSRHGADVRGKVRRLGQALGRIAHDPDRLAPPRTRLLEPSLLVAVALTAAQLLAPRLGSGRSTHNP